MPSHVRAPEFLRDLGLPARSLLQSRWARVNGCSLHSRSSGRSAQGPPFVLIHGLVISSLYMIPLAESLAAGHEVHALDLPGFGRSKAPKHVLSIAQLADSVVSWLEATGTPRCHLVANSLGCQIAAHVAVKAPSRLASLVLVGPTIDPAAFALTTQILRLLHDAWHEPIRLWLNWLFDFWRAGVPRALGTTREMFRDHIEQQLPLIAAPTLIIRGATDPTVPESATQTMTRLLPHGELLTIPDQPHCVHYTAPATIYGAIEAFVSRLPSAR